jgi:endonuclease/exonuclease/phosphatase family metal-dependent hydrolase
MAGQLSLLQKTLNQRPEKRFPSTLPTTQPVTKPRHLQRWNFNVPDFDLPDGLEVVTWNMEHFPKANDSTITAVAEIMEKLNADLYAVQEIQSLRQLSALMDLLPAYDFQVTRQSAYLDQAIIYKRSALTCVGREEPFADDDYNFAGRGPLRVDFFWHHGEQTVPVSVFDIHLKCCGNGLERRKKSMEQLHDYLSLGMEMGEENIIVLGDWNDQLDDVGQLQSFGPFLDDPDQFEFATARIAGDVEQASYPSWPVFWIRFSSGRVFLMNLSRKPAVFRPCLFRTGWEPSSAMS